MDEREEYRRRTPKCAAEFKRASKLIPGGVASAIQYRAPHPIYIARSQGAHVWDLDGNEYIDYSLCFAAMIAGHANPIVAEAIKAQAEKGTLYGMPTELASDMALEIQRRYPVMEMMRFTQSGVEATMSAVRLARAATGKDKLVKIEGTYHGAADHLLVSIGPVRMEMAGPAWAPTPVVETLGAPKGMTQDTLVVPFNDLEATEACFKRHEGEIACLIVEPVMTNGGVIPPEPGYLQGLRELTRQYNILLIFDEVKVGCRIAPGGACERYNVQPDLVTLAKAIGGGTPLGAFGGRRDLMEMVSPMGGAIHFGTYNANPLVLAAGLACLTKVLTPEAYDHINRLGDRLAQGQREIIERLGVPASVTQVGPLGGIIFTPEPPRNYREANRCDKEMWERYWFGMLNHGVIPMGTAWFEEWSISVAHTDEDIDRTLEATEDVLRAIMQGR